MDQTEQKEPELSHPPGWGSDTLSDFLEAAHRNRFATFANKKGWYDRLAGIDGCFMRIATDWLNPQNHITPLLFLRSHAAYRGACEHALAGAVGETYPDVRACLEYAAYALHIYRNPTLTETWLRRHDNVDATNAVRREFATSNVRKSVKAANQFAATVFDSLYQRAIDFGAHPNERAITGNMIINDSSDRVEFQQVYLHGDGLRLDHGLKTTAQAGICALELLQDVFAPRFELLGVRAELLELRKGL